jgi:hypothetical protein
MAKSKKNLWAYSYVHNCEKRCISLLVEFSVLCGERGKGKVPDGMLISVYKIFLLCIEKKEFGAI